MPEGSKDNPAQNTLDEIAPIDTSQKGQAPQLDTQNQPASLTASQDITRQNSTQNVSLDLSGQNVSQEQPNAINQRGQNKIPQDELIAYSCIGLGVIFVFAGMALMIL